MDKGRSVVFTKDTGSNNGSWATSNSDWNNSGGWENWSDGGGNGQQGEESEGNELF